MKKITWFCITALFLYLNVFCPKCLGEHIWIGKVHEKFYGEEYEEERSLYFIKGKFQKEWKKVDSSFYICDVNDREIGGIVTTLWHSREYEVRGRELIIYTDDMGTIKTKAIVPGEKFTETKEILEENNYVSEAGKFSNKVSQKAFSTRQEYRSALRQISDWEYHRIRKKGICTLLFFAVTWVAIFFCSKRKKKSAEELDEQEYIGSMDYQLTMIVSVFMIVLSFSVLGVGLLVLMLF